MWSRLEAVLVFLFMRTYRSAFEKASNQFVEELAQQLGTEVPAATQLPPKPPKADMPPLPSLPPAPERTHQLPAKRGPGRPRKDPI